MKRKVRVDVAGSLYYSKQKKEEETMNMIMPYPVAPWWSVKNLFTVVDNLQLLEGILDQSWLDEHADVNLKERG